MAVGEGAVVIAAEVSLSREGVNFSLFTYGTKNSFKN